MNRLELNSIFTTARVTDKAAATARSALASVMLQAMRNLLTPGTVIKLNEKPLPEYLLSVRTMSGSDRGTKTFRIIEVTYVAACPYAPERSTWHATAVPISETTGKEMSGAVSLHGDIGCRILDDVTDTDAVDRLLDLVAKNSTPAPADVLPKAA